jgi:signal transduction histidine kinase
LIRSFFKKYYLSFVFGLITIAVFYLISLYSYLLYHSLAELFTIVIAFGIFIVVWNTRKLLDNNFFLFIGIAYLFVALIDLFHTLSYKGMGVFTSFAGSNLATQLWIAARYLQAISLLLAIFFITKRLNYIIQFICYLIVIILLLLSIFYWKVFPVSFIEGSGITTFKIASEYIISFILAVEIFFLYLYRKEFNKTVFLLIIASIVLTILSELSFTLYSDVYGLFNQLGHFLKLLSFFLIYKAIIEIGFSQPVDLLFFKLDQSEKDLKESEEKYRSLYFSMNEGSTLDELIYDESKKPIDYRILDVNDTALSILGFRRDQILGKKASEVYDMDITPYLNIFAQVIESGKPYRFENYYPHLKKYFTISIFSPFKGRFATLFTDITVQKKYEMEIESLSRFPSENPNPVMRMNNKDLIIFANESAKILLQRLDNEKRSNLLRFLHSSVMGSEKKSNKELSMIEFKIGKSIYEFSVIYIKDFDYYNIYGREITDKKNAEILRARIMKEKTLNEERNKLARELHDTVTQTLFSSNLISEAIPKLWKKDPEKVFERIEEIKQLNKFALAEMRVLLHELRPSTFREESLGELLKELVKSIESRTKIPVELIINGEYKFPSKIELAFYRISQELLNNIIKHSRATKASVILKILPEKLYLDITDNGCGFDDKKIASSNLGVTIMKERAKLIKASISIDSMPGKGTRVTVTYNRKTTVKKKNHK